MRLNVTQKNIDDAKDQINRNNWSSYCPIALAYKDAAGQDYASVSTSHLFFSDEDYLYRIALPEEASKFVRDHDDKKFITPFSFELDLDAAEKLNG